MVALANLTLLAYLEMAEPLQMVSLFLISACQKSTLLPLLSMPYFMEVLLEPPSIQRVPQDTNCQITTYLQVANYLLPHTLWPIQVQITSLPRAHSAKFQANSLQKEPILLQAHRPPMEHLTSNLLAQKTLPSLLMSFRSPTTILPY